MARASGLAPLTVQRIWKAFSLQPHRSETFKLSTDPLFVDKVRDIVGLYVDPPDRAVVLCVDERSPRCKRPTAHCRPCHCVRGRLNVGATTPDMAPPRCSRRSTSSCSSTVAASAFVTGGRTVARLAAEFERNPAQSGK
jgi:hypothetical protein